MTLRLQLQDVHAELLGEIARLEAATSAAAPDPDLAAIRLRLSRASGRRMRLIEQQIVPFLLNRATGGEADSLARLRADMAAARSRSSQHVARWSLDAAKKDWPGYCEASAEIRVEMRAQIERERAVLDPLLRKAEVS
ncbi:MAG TPA: hypothetical protein VFT56_12520 [Sphingomonas sp.]|nr:hypothetical protein [Sphingomonas sp.]